MAFQSPGSCKSYELSYAGSDCTETVVLVDIVVFAETVVVFDETVVVFDEIVVFVEIVVFAVVVGETVVGMKRGILSSSVSVIVSPVRPTNNNIEHIFNVFEFTFNC